MSASRSCIKSTRPCRVCRGAGSSWKLTSVVLTEINRTMQVSRDPSCGTCQHPRRNGSSDPPSQHGRILADSRVFIQPRSVAECPLQPTVFRKRTGRFRPRLSLSAVGLQRALTSVIQPGNLRSKADANSPDTTLRNCAKSRRLLRKVALRILPQRCQ
jgi:hypothetical protein